MFSGDVKCRSVTWQIGPTCRFGHCPDLYRERGGRMRKFLMAARIAVLLPGRNFFTSPSRHRN